MCSETCASVWMLASRETKREDALVGEVGLPNKHSGSTLVVMTASPCLDDEAIKGGKNRK